MSSSGATSCEFNQTHLDQQNSKDDNTTANVTAATDILPKSCLKIKTQVESLERSIMNHPPATTGMHKKQQQHVVKFNKVHIKFYPIVLSENPGCSDGKVSIELGWEYFLLPSSSRCATTTTTTTTRAPCEQEDDNGLNINIFEQIRCKQRHVGGCYKLYLPPYERIRRLRDIGYTQEEINKATKHIHKIQLQRYQSMLITEEMELHEQEKYEKIKQKLSKHNKKHWWSSKKVSSSGIRQPKVTLMKKSTSTGSLKERLLRQLSSSSSERS